MSEPTLSGGALVLDGALVAKALRTELATRTLALKQQYGIVPGLAAVLAGDNPASVTYVSMKRKACAKVGIVSFEHVFGTEATQEEVLACVRALNADPAVHGILVQHPMPKHLNEDEILATVDPAKDVDGIGRASLGDLVLGHPSFVSCTPQGMMTLLARYGIDPAGKHAVVVGRSVILGKPMAIALLNANATVTICHSKTKNLAEFTRQADILVAAVGRPELITGDMLKPGAVVLDAGYNRVEGRGHDVGDCHYESCSAVASAITPVPGGVGPMTIATLLEQTIQAAERAARL